MENMFIKQENILYKEADSASGNVSIPSLVSWKGNYNFHLNVPVNNDSSTKWCYNSQKNKIFACSNVVFPIELCLDTWINGFITITPVYKRMNEIMKPVLRCHNCIISNSPDFRLKDHLIQTENMEEVVYNEDNGRFSLNFPLGEPDFGSNRKCIYLKSMCLTSCVGGPNRRPFSLLISLSQGGKEVGRQIMDFKCCKCPTRDMRSDKSQATQFLPKPEKRDEDMSDVVKTIAEKLRNQSNNEEFARIRIPAEFADNVKRFTNFLAVEKYINSVDPTLLPFPESAVNNKPT